MKCKVCGVMLPDACNFCPNCGVKINDDEKRNIEIEVLAKNINNISKRRQENNYEKVTNSGKYNGRDSVSEKKQSSLNKFFKCLIYLIPKLFTLIFNFLKYLLIVLFFFLREVLKRSH